MSHPIAWRLTGNLPRVSTGFALQTHCQTKLILVLGLKGHNSLLRIWIRVAGGSRSNSTNEVTYMLWTIFVILLVLWLLGLVSSYTLGGYIHILLVIAVVVLVINLITGRRPAL